MFSQCLDHTRPVLNPRIQTYDVLDRVNSDFTSFLAHKTTVFNILSCAADLETAFSVYTFWIFQLFHKITPGTRCLIQRKSKLNPIESLFNHAVWPKNCQKHKN